MTAAVKSIAVAGLLALSVGSHAQTAVSIEGYPACQSEQWLNDLVAMAAAKDIPSVNAYLRSEKCITMKGGLRVTPVSGYGLFGGTNKAFIFQGQRFWTTNEGIRLIGYDE